MSSVADCCAEWDPEFGDEDELLSMSPSAMIEHRDQEMRVSW